MQPILAASAYLLSAHLLAGSKIDMCAAITETVKQIVKQ